MFWGFYFLDDLWNRFCLFEKIIVRSLLGFDFTYLQTFVPFIIPQIRIFLIYTILIKI